MTGATRPGTLHLSRLNRLRRISKMSDTGNDAAPTPVPSMAPFFTLWGGQVFSLLGCQLAQFSMVWWLAQSTGSATVLAFATMMALLPQAVT
jgi:hypothetical protein